MIKSLFFTSNATREEFLQDMQEIFSNHLRHKLSVQYACSRLTCSTSFYSSDRVSMRSRQILWLHLH